MISKISLTRIEPCFWANKPASGEISKVKKDNSNTSQPKINSAGVDTFTASDGSREVSLASKELKKENQKNK